jgi:hypothetical protein
VTLLILKLKQPPKEYLKYTKTEMNSNNLKKIEKLGSGPQNFSDFIGKSNPAFSL